MCLYATIKSAWKNSLSAKYWIKTQGAVGHQGWYLSVLLVSYLCVRIYSIHRGHHVYIPLDSFTVSLHNPNGRHLPAVKLRSHMRGAVAERRRADFDIPAPLPQVCSHIHGADAERTRSGRGRICHFLRTMMVWSTRFWSGRGKLGVGPISCGAVFAPAPPPLRDRACVNACNDLCWSQFFARPRPRPPAHVWTYL